MHIALISLSPALTASIKESTENKQLILFASKLDDLLTPAQPLDLIIFDASLTRNLIIRQITAHKEIVP